MSTMPMLPKAALRAKFLQTNSKNQQDPNILTRNGPDKVYSLEFIGSKDFAEGTQGMKKMEIGQTTQQSLGS